MNANELADKLSSWEGYYGYCDEAIAMLRQFGLAESIIKQQQIEIEALKAEKQETAIDMLNLYGRIDQLEKETNDFHEHTKHWVLKCKEMENEVAKWKMSYENNIRFEEGYGHN